MEVDVNMKAQITLKMKMIFAMTCDIYTIRVPSIYEVPFYFQSLFQFLFCSQQTIFRYLKFDFLISNNHLIISQHI